MTELARIDAPPHHSSAVSGEEETLNALGPLGAGIQLRRQRWVLALAAEARDDADACLEHCLAVLAHDPGDRGALLLGARAARGLGSWVTAARLLGQALADEPGPSPLDWDRLVAATIAGDDAGVDSSAARLGLHRSLWTDPDRLVMVLLSGRVHVARRVGPARAEILTIATGDRPQHVGDVVAYDPSPTAGGADEAHRALAILQPGTQRVWSAIGADPGFAAWEDAVAMARARGWTMRRTTRFDAARQHGVVGVVAVPSRDDPAEVCDMLTALSDSWDQPVTWAG